MQKTLMQEMEAMLNRQIILGVEAVYSAIYSGPKIETLSFHHILNRVMMLVQVPMTFVIMKHVEGNTYTEYFRTNRHPRHSEDIVKSIKSSKPENYFPLWHTDEHEDFYLLVLKADSGREGYKFPPLNVLKDITSEMNLWDLASYKLNAIFDAQNFSKYPGFSKGIQEIIKSTRDSLVSNDGKNSTVRMRVNGMYREKKDAFDEKLLRSNTDFKFQNLNRFGVIDRIFSKIKDNIWDVNDTVGGLDEMPTLTNFMLFARDYYDTPNHNWRHGDYNYNLRMLVCDSQKLEIAQFLRGFLQNEESLRLRYKKELQLVSNARSKKLAFEAEEVFWDYLRRGEDGINDLLQILSEYLGEKTRSMADPVFDGVSFHRQPFANDGGMARCFNEKDELPASFSDLPPKSEIRHDLIRVILCQYLFDGMAAYANLANNLQLQIMLNPVEIGGRVWGVVAYTTRSFSPDTILAAKEDINNYEIFWLKNYHIYRDINERMKKNLRSYMNQLYENTVASRYVDVVNEFGLSTANYKISDLENSINRELWLLSCMFPYDVLKVRVRRDEDTFPLPNSLSETGRHRALAGRYWASHVEIDVSSSPFPAAPGVPSDATGVFVDRTDVAVAMSEALLRGTLNFKPNQQGRT